MPNTFSLLFHQIIIVMKIFSLAFLLLFLFPFVFPITDSEQKLNKNKPGVANIVFKSTDGGQSWQDISEGLPGDKLEGSLFVNDRGFWQLYISQ